MQYIGYLGTQQRTIAGDGNKQIITATVVIEHENDDLEVMETIVAHDTEIPDRILVIKADGEEAELDKLDEDEITALSQRARNREMQRNLRKYKKKPGGHKRLLGYYVERRPQRGVGSGKGKRFRAVIYYIKKGKVQRRFQALNSRRAVPGFTPKKGSKALSPNQVRGKMMKKERLMKMVSLMSKKGGGDTKRRTANAKPTNKPKKSRRRGA